jgi:transposase
LRDLVRQRVRLIEDKARAANRLQKVLEDANIKLASVATDVLGVSGREMIRALIEGKLSPAAIAQLARLRLRLKIPQLTEALEGNVGDHHRFMLKAALEQVEYLEKQIERFDARIEQVLDPLERKVIERLDAIPGFDRRAAQNVVAEVGIDMTRFGSSGHLASWAGICPGNNQSAGKRRTGRMNDGNRWLKRTLAQCAWAATRCKNSYFRSMHRRLAARRGAKRAAMAVAHAQLRVVYEIIKQDCDYKDLGVDYFERANADRLKGQLVTRLQRLGYKVSLEQADAA